MDFSRRGFIHLLGLAGIGLAATESVPRVALFGSDEIEDKKELILPGRDLFKGHYVVYPKRLIEPIPEEDKESLRRKYGVDSGVTVVARLVKNREPVRPLLRRDGEISSRRAFIEGGLVSDGHASFYLASNEIREKFSSFSRETLLQVPEDLRSMTTLVTIAEDPIHATSFYRESSDGPERGFDVRAAFKQFAVVGMPQREIQTFITYSTTGEYPLSIPRDVDMSLLIKMDREVLSTRENSPDRIGLLLNRFTQSWRSSAGRT